MNWELKDTVNLMTCGDYKTRMRAEYLQTKIRYEKLKRMNEKIEVSHMCEVNVEEPKHDCPYEILRNQQAIMGEYLHILEVRAIIENIDLYGEPNRIEQDAKDIIDRVCEACECSHNH